MTRVETVTKGDPERGCGGLSVGGKVSPDLLKATTKYKAPSRAFSGWKVQLEITCERKILMVREV